ncbi:Glucose/arabinose dehydrogenase, beta-propeller fold [Andreprevotia lacus DSM 23236]|jgi:glucose/arabinose dehydrogenase|uniref:Glucose/arabinose dehydrogenase, beta-propeller fold n=1 Tax=Andreprevotia lacus DSM 23236 TaxID=1121001 RepID=A0A1W1XDH5_9NEIS|nr:PQQ-dependent sugar dehydrogenase [Andreprevotia lacus]SMC21939.1 Glucose/arabinose dehydrogenase, beta-propeller fold [Andreprevotia lacus DSM 23236]
MPFFRFSHTAVALALSCASLGAYAADAYQPQGECAGLPRLNLKVAQGFCLGLAATGLGMPRGVLPLADGSVLVVDMGGWGRGKGRLLKLVRDGKQYQPTVLLTGLNRPYGIQLGPDGWVYLGEDDRIVRFNPKEASVTPQVVIDDHPSEGRHPLTSFVFGKQGEMYVNVGAPTDNCEGHIEASKPVLQSCPDVDGEPVHAGIRKYVQQDGKWAWTVVARGLRNSMALAVHPKTGTLWQGENSRDYINKKIPGLKNDDNLPHEELNKIVQGGNYGWPYCYDDNVASPEFPAADCKGMIKPARLWPGHAAPLGMVYYNAAKAPAGWRDGLVVTFHGYRSNGYRLVFQPFNAAGEPAGNFKELIAGWKNIDGKQPMGAPTDVKADAQGTLWVTEDRNGTLLALVPQQ